MLLVRIFYLKNPGPFNSVITTSKSQRLHRVPKRALNKDEKIDRYTHLIDN